MPDELVVEELYRLAHESDNRLIGKALLGSPFEMTIFLDFTGLRGSGPNIYHSLVFQLPKWAYNVAKVDEWMHVTPEYVEFYNITMEQKHKLEGAIKSGLTSATQAVADFELLAHDLRRYREILDYFVSAEKKKEQHVVRSFFVDRVDNFTGEGYSLISIVKRWPTIISDFIRMDEQWSDVNTIRKNLDVTQAEATVLKTKNELFKEWKTMFLPELKRRYARIKNLVDARKKSVDEYRKWLKPYIAQHKMMKESLEENPAATLLDPTYTPGFGQSQAATGVRVWAWKSFTPSEKGKPESIKERKGFVIDPYDDFVREWQEKIEQMYHVTFTEKEVREILEDAKKKNLSGVSKMSPHDLYYIFFDLKVELALIRTPPPEGVELDNIMFKPVRAWVMSQNVLLIHLLEMKAREKAMHNYVNEIIGATEREEDIFKEVEKEFEPEKPERFRGLKQFSQKLKPPLGKIKAGLTWFFYLFFKRGPYEVNFEERITKQYFRGVAHYYVQMVEFLKGKMKIE